MTSPCIYWLRRVEVQVCRLAFALHPDGRRTAAAESRHLWFDNANGECRGDNCVDRVAAGSKHLYAGFAGEAIGGSHDPVPGFNPLAFVDRRNHGTGTLRMKRGRRRTDGERQPQGKNR
jgi:hypothetical protein